jgi:hypothetical protein
MSKQFESIMRGLQQVADYKNGDKTKCRVRTITAQKHKKPVLNLIERNNTVKNDNPCKNVIK